MSGEGHRVGRDKTRQERRTAQGARIRAGRIDYGATGRSAGAEDYPPSMESTADAEYGLPLEFK